MVSKLYGVNATIIIFVFVLYDDDDDDDDGDGGDDILSTPQHSFSTACTTSYMSTVRR